MSEVKLLPLPNSGSGFYEDNVWHDTFSKSQMVSYARANVEPLIAENERLRAEVISAKNTSAYQWQAAQEANKRAERLAEALRSLLGSVDDLTSYVAEDDEIGHRPCCHVLSYKEHTDDCAITKARAALDQENNDD